MEYFIYGDRLYDTENVERGEEHVIYSGRLRTKEDPCVTYGGGGGQVRGEIVTTRTFKEKKKLTFFCLFF